MYSWVLSEEELWLEFFFVAFQRGFVAAVAFVAFVGGAFVALPFLLVCLSIYLT